MEKLAPRFATLLRGYDTLGLREHSGVIYGLWPDFRLAYLNPAWFQFAIENGGEPKISREWQLGSSILDAMTSPVREFYATNYRNSLTTYRVWTHEYECSSETVYRWLHQMVYPLGRREGLLIVNSVRIERPHDPRERMARQAVTAIYRDNNGFMHQCAHCRRVKNLLEVERWDWIPEWVRVVPNAVTHTLCPPCFAHYYPSAANG